MKIVLGALVLLVGFAIGRGVGELRDAPPLPETTSIEDAEPASGESATREVPPPETDELNPSDAWEARLRAAMSALPEAKTRGPLETLTGTVRDRWGVPIVGERVKLLPVDRDPNLPGRSARPAPPPKQAAAEDLIDAAMKTLHSRLRSKQAERTTVSDADGRFRFESLAGDLYRVVPATRGRRFEVRVNDVTTNLVRPGSVVSIIATAAVHVPIDVRLPDGTQPPGATLSTPGRSKLPYWTPTKAVVPLEPGYYQLSASVGTLGESRPVRFELVAGVTPEPIELLIESRTDLTLIATVPPDYDNSPIHFYLLEADRAGTPDAETIAQLGLAIPAYASRGRAKQRRFGLTPGEYWVGCGFSYGRVDVVGRVDLRFEEVTWSCDLPAPARDSVIRLRALDATGALISWVSVELSVRGLTAWEYQDMVGSIGEVKLPDGTIELPLTPAIAKLARAGELELDVTAPKLGTRTVPVDSLDLTVRFGRVGNLTVEVLGVPPERETEVAVALKRRGTTHAESDERNDAGVFELSAEIGEYDLVAQVSWDDIVIQPVTVTERTQHIVIELPPTARLELTFDAEPPEIIWARALQGDATAEATITDGRAVFESLHIGDYALYGERSMMRITLDANRIVEFRPFLPNGIELLRTIELDAENDQLTPDDVIVAINGEQFEGVDQLGRAWVVLLSHTEVTVTVRRGDAVREVVVPSRMFYEDENSFVPTRVEPVPDAPPEAE